VIIPQVGARLTEAALKSVLKEGLADYKVPKSIYVMDSEKVPRTDSGKIKKSVLLEIVKREIS